jgi:hypothetical protein
MIVPADKGSVEGAVILPFPLDRIRPAGLPGHGPEGGTGSTVVSLATRLPIVFLRPVPSTVGSGTLPPAA